MKVQTIQKKTHRYRKRLTDIENKFVVTKAEKERGEGQTKSMGLTDTNTTYKIDNSYTVLLKLFPLSYNTYNGI